METLSKNLPKESSSYKWFILGNVMISTFMVVLDSTVVNTALPNIMGTLGASMNTAEWILTGYMLSMATVLSTTGWLSNRFGYKNVFIASLIIFTFGSFMSGNSSSIGELIFWRIIEGIGGGLLMPVGMSIITTVFPPEQRSMALGFWAIASAASVSFGPMIGSYLVDNFNWNYIFYVNIPIGVLCVIVTIVLQKRYEHEGNLKLDIPGLITSSLFLPIFLYGLSQVNSSTNPEGWSSPIVMGCMWISAVSFILFIYFELNTENPLIDLQIFKDWKFSIANLVTFVFAIGMFGSTFLIPLYMQDNLGYSAFEAGLVFLPVGMVQAICSPAAGRMAQSIDPRIIIVTGLVMLAVSFFVTSEFTLQTDRSTIIASLILRGTGMGILFPPLLGVALDGITPQQMAQASSLTNIIRQVGGSVGVAYFTFLLTIRRNYHTQIYSEEINYSGETYRSITSRLSEFFSSVGSDTPSSAMSQSKAYLIDWLNTEAYIKGINDDFFIGGIITAIAIIPVLFLTKKKNQIKQN